MEKTILNPEQELQNLPGSERAILFVASARAPAGLYWDKWSVHGPNWNQ
jgi:hypothetical protein